MSVILNMSKTLKITRLQNGFFEMPTIKKFGCLDLGNLFTQTLESIYALQYKLQKNKELFD